MDGLRELNDNDNTHLIRISETRASQIMDKELEIFAILFVFYTPRCQVRVIYRNLSTDTG